MRNRAAEVFPSGTDCEVKINFRSSEARPCLHMWDGCHLLLGSARWSEGHCPPRQSESAPRAHPPGHQQYLGCPEYGREAETTTTASAKHHAATELGRGPVPTCSAKTWCALWCLEEELGATSPALSREMWHLAKLNFLLHSSASHSVFYM